MSRPTASTPRRLLWSRWLVLALLSLTLPLQGALAATMAIGMALMAPTVSQTGAVMTMPTHCEEMVMSDMSGMASIEAATLAPDAAAMTDMPAMSAMDGMSGMDAADHAGIPVPDIASHAGHAIGMDHGDDSSSSDHHCGICLQCCIGAAIPVAPLIVAAQDLRDVAPTLGAIGAPEQLPQSLDRPPKPLLA